MTSGNHGGEPICITNNEARKRLGGIADYLLIHDREINLRNDDSLCTIQHGFPQLWRRSRGYSPNPIRLQQKLTYTVLAMGADMKNTISVAYDNFAVLSPHIGDLETPEALDSLESVASSLPLFLKKEPQRVAVDMHPDMQSTILGRKIARKTEIPVTETQHHHAHAAACLAENGFDSGLSLVFDGTGIGTDGTIWGAELLTIDQSGFKRLSTFVGVPLPGGDTAVRNPARQLVSRFTSCGCCISDEWFARLGISDIESSLWARQCLDSINAPFTHAAGRLLDSFSTLLGFAPHQITYEGQPAIRLEAAAHKFKGPCTIRLPFKAIEHKGKLLIDWSDSFAMLSDIKVFKGRESEYAMAVHHAVKDAALQMVAYGLTMTSLRTIALSGGVFMNRILNNILIPAIEDMGLNVVIHRLTPPNDGCISFGQAVIAGR